MMNVREYAEDISRTVEEVLSLCKELEIKCETEEDMLSMEDIVILDNQLQSEPNEELQEVIKEIEEIEHAEKIAEELSIDLEEEDGNHNFEKFKSKTVKKTEAKKEFFKERKNMYKNREKLQSNEVSQDDETIIYSNNMSVGDLAKKLDVAATELIKKLMKLGIMANVNQALDFDTAELLVVDFNKKLVDEKITDITNFEEFEITDNEEALVERAPVVTVMGHVDHGKTSLLDKIRESSVVSNEAGGITQAIGAYSVTCNDKQITFIDTPGHEAFTEMRARGASITDIVIIIVAADDGVKLQTKEAIDHAKDAGVPIIVAINKIDKPDINLDKVMNGLVEAGLNPEEWGGDTIINKVSAHTGEGINELLENILLVSEMQQLKANPNKYATGTVIESEKDLKTGTIATILIQGGTLRLGDPVVVGVNYGKVRTMRDDKGHNITEAGPSVPVEITGLTGVPSAGDKFMAFEAEKKAKQVAAQRKTRAKEMDQNFSGMTLDELFGKIQEGKLKEIKVILKADVNGSLEAVTNSLNKINVDGVVVKIIRSGVGAITENDVILASASGALVIGFNLKTNPKLLENASSKNVEIKSYDIIYKIVEDITSIMNGMLEPIYEEKVIGKAEIRQIFKFSKVGQIAGCHVISGIIKNKAKARLLRKDETVYEGSIATLQSEQNQVKEMTKGFDCGITLLECEGYQENDIIEVYELIEVKR